MGMGRKLATMSVAACLLTTIGQIPAFAVETVAQETSDAINGWTLASANDPDTNAENDNITPKVNNGKSYIDPETDVLDTETAYEWNAGWIWSETEQVWRWGIAESEGEIAKSQWIYTGGAWYWFDADGVMATGLEEIDSSWYHFRSSGAMTANSWALEDGSWYLAASSGALRTGWANVGGAWYWMNPESCAMVTGKQEINGGTYYFNAGGDMATGWAWDASESCWYLSSGSSDGRLRTGWANVGGAWYYLSPEDYKMATGWTEVNGTNYYLDANGAAHTGWLKSDETWYHFDESGTPSTGWLLINDRWYYFEDGGVMATGWITVGGSKFYLDDSGVMTSGWRLISGRWYWYGENNDGNMAVGWRFIDGKWYYFRTDGRMQVNGFHSIKDSNGTWQMYYFDGTGAMVTGWYEYDDGWWYYFHESGVMLKDQWIGNYHLSVSGLMDRNTWVDDKYYVGDDGAWIPEYDPSTAKDSASIK